MKTNLMPLDVGRLSWQNEQTEESLETIFGFVVEKAKGAVNWYLHAKRPKKRIAVLLRALAIFIAAIAGAMPVLDDQSISLFGASLTVSATWTYVFLAIAGALVLVDRVFGYSSGWMRYITTGHQISQVLDEFRLDWEADKAAWQDDGPTKEEVQKMLTRAKSFVVKVNTIIQNETKEWITEFKASLKQFDAKLEQLREEAVSKIEEGKPGSLNVVVENGEQCGDGWALFIDGEEGDTYRGKTAAVLDLKPGSHSVRARGKIGGKDRQAEKVATVPVGGVGTAKLTLS